MTEEISPKPIGAVPSEFVAEDGMLLVGGVGVAALIDEAETTPCFAYDAAMIEARIAALRAALPRRCDIHYAIKANPFPPLLRFMGERVGGFDIASAGELTAALTAGVTANRISFAGPGKTDAELHAAIDQGVTLNVESEGEGRRILRIGEERGRVPRVAVRVNPDIELKGSGMRMGGGAKPFGVDAARAPALARLLVEGGCEWRGWHIFAGSQSLDGDAIIAMQAATIALAATLSDTHGVRPPLVNLGGGFGVPYFAGDRPLDIQRIGEVLGEAIAAAPPVLDDSSFAIELGRWLVAEAGVYLTRIVDVKDSHGERFAVVDGGLHHQLAASGNFGTVIRRNYPIALANRFGEAACDRPTSVVGCLCTPLDRLGERVALPEPDVGDLVALFMAGAYGASASPATFLGHATAPEMLIHPDGVIERG